MNFMMISLRPSINRPNLYGISAVPKMLLASVFVKKWFTKYTRLLAVLCIAVPVCHVYHSNYKYERNRENHGDLYDIPAFRLAMEKVKSVNFTECRFASRITQREMDDNQTSPVVMDTCPQHLSDDILYQSLSYLLRDFEESERLIREPDMKLARGIKFLETYRNPCWLEELPSKPYVFPMNEWPKLIKYSYLRREYCKMEPVFEKRQKMWNTEKNGYKNGTRLRCLPYVFLLGVAKAGTTDLTTALGKHPMVELPLQSEPQFWGRLPMRRNTFTDYLNFYDRVSYDIERHTDETGFHPKITIDASTHTFTSYYDNWETHPWNRKPQEQCITLPDHLHYLTPHSKYILMVREPAALLTSCYNFFSSYQTSLWSEENFRKTIIQQIDSLQKCFDSSSNDLYCVYSLVGNEYCHVGVTVYYLWTKLWFEKVGRNNVMVINSDVYYKNRLPVVKETVEFLGLPAMSVTLIEKVKSQRIVNAGKNKAWVLDEYTTTALRRFIQPWNHKLAVLLDDESFRWNV